MDVFDRVGEFFTGMTALAERGIRGVFGSSNERQVRRVGFIRHRDGRSEIIPGSVLDRINQLEPDFERLSDGELKGTTVRLRAMLADGKTLDDILPEAFAAVRESGKRYLKMRHYDVQMVGGYALHQGKIAEMVTGEGKTLVCTLPAYLNALAGKVHVVTVNDYLAKRDMEWVGPTHIGLGLSVGAIQSIMQPHERQPQYACDITYGTSNEFGFDYLRDNMKSRQDLQVQGHLDYAIVDEIDNILIDEARTPLIISGPAHDDVTKYSKADKVARQLQSGVDFEVKEKEHSCHLTESGIRRAEQLAGVESFYTTGNMEWPHLIDQALKAHFLYKRDVSYVVEQGEIVIVDENTGRKMPGRQWSDGLHQACEAKEGVRVKQVSQTLATVTLQNYFKLYNKLGGMTGTAMTESTEFMKIYNLEVVAIPTNRPTQRINHPDVIYRTEREKWNAVVNEIVDVNQTGRPILVGTKSIEKSELLSAMLGRRGIKHEVLNARHHEREAEIIAQAGRLASVTIATNMAGRGTDIILGGNPEFLAWETLKTQFASRLDVPKSVWDNTSDEISNRLGMKAEGRKVAEVGGLHVIGSERHDSRRIDLQLRGRSGRQGDPGSSRFFLSLEDDLMRIFAGDWVKGVLAWLGMQEGEAIEHSMVTKQIEKAQKKVEERHFDSRKNLLEYDEVMDFQRKMVYSYRQRLLDGASCRDIVLEMMSRQVAKQVEKFLAVRYPAETVAAWATSTLGIDDIKAHDVHGMDRDQAVLYLTTEAERQAERLLREQIEETLPEGQPESEWNWQALCGWFNRRYSQNVTPRDLRSVALPGGPETFDPGRLHEAMVARAIEHIEKTDFSPLDMILHEDFGRNQLSGWLNHQYGLTIPSSSFGRYEEPEKTTATVMVRIRERYDEQDAIFPVNISLMRFQVTANAQGDREGLIRWANNRFRSQLEGATAASNREVVDQIVEKSREFLPKDDISAQVKALLNRAFPLIKGKVGPLQDVTALRELHDFVFRRFDSELDLDEMKKQTPEQIELDALKAYEKKYRPEMGQAERLVLLEVLDNSWKEHLYSMDFLRQNVGLVGYAQKDPKVEYKRQGMEQFDGMWEGIAEQVTASVFRLEREGNPNFLNDVWHETAAVHETAAPVSAVAEAPTTPTETGYLESGTQPGQAPATIEPIRNREKKVGRNDPCPCGSGKKYKNCHGA
ncbi:MAG: preprotein translocase subunit SecA [Planctomycetota bacterium]|nr:MAG: preprotein translocase subunit SecA [Planctomycetota bacterium]